MPMNDEVGREIAAGREVFLPLVAILKGEQTGRTLRQARADYVAVKARQQPPPGVSFDQVAMGGVSGIVATPQDAIDGRVLFYLHGGGYVSGGPGASRAEVGRFARSLRARPVAC